MASFLPLCFRCAREIIKGTTNQFQFNLVLENFSYGLENREYSRGDPLRRPLHTLYPQKLTSRTSGDRSVGIVGSLTKATEFSFFSFYLVFYLVLYLVFSFYVSVVVEPDRNIRRSTWRPSNVLGRISDGTLYYFKTKNVLNKAAEKNEACFIIPCMKFVY
jgi:hypothetical protein